MLVCIYTLFLFALFSPLSRANKFKNLVVFGDSYSDNGRRWKSVDRTWNEHLARRFGQRRNTLLNFAESSATCDNRLVKFGTAASVKDQVAMFYHRRLDGGALEPEETLYAIWIGINDLRGIDVVANLTAYSNARYFLLLNIPPLHKTPLHHNQTLFRPIVAKYNELLQMIQSPAPTYLMVVDMNALFEDMIARPAAYELDEVVEYFGEKRLTNRTASRNLDRYLWMDEIHPSNVVHKFISDHILTELDDMLVARRKSTESELTIPEMREEIAKEFDKSLGFKFAFVSILLLVVAQFFRRRLWQFLE